MVAKIDKVKAIIREYFDNANCGIFDCRNITGDTMETIYEEDGVTVDICYGYMYFEVFGLSNEEFAEVEKYYHELKRGVNK